MPGPTSRIGLQGASAPGADYTLPAQALDDALQTLLTEAAALANQLRKTSAPAHPRDQCPAVGRAVLQILDRLGPQTVPAIARLRALSRQSVQTLVNRLASQGYVTITPNPAHKRSGLVCLTDRGRRLRAALVEREAEAAQALLPHLSHARLLPAARLLRQLRQLLAGGHPLPPADIAEARPLPAKPARRRRPAPPAATPPPQPVEQEETGLPVNLL
jgi:DNA-binding MarR family transcriptional regulator